MNVTTADRPEQLTLLTPGAVPVRFRLDEATRRRGLAHIAAIRAQLERARLAREAAAERPAGRSPRRPAPRAA